MKLTQKRANQITACIQMVLVGIMTAFAFEIRIGNKVKNKLKKKRLKKAKRKGTAV